MSPGHSAQRIYDVLKMQIMTGARAEAERLDPARLALDLDVSATPVRDALHQLFGERLVDAWPREGFRVPVLGASTLADLYRWNGEVAGLMLRNLKAPLGIAQPLAAHDAENPAEVARAFFAGLAAWLGNGEHAAALAQASDRLHRARLAEPQVIEDNAEELSALAQCRVSERIPELRHRLARYHRRRQVCARQILAVMRGTPSQK